MAAAQTPPRKEPNLGGDLDLASQDPAVALTRLKPAAGYEVALFASEREFPELANPLAMTFDTRGRLWVLTSPTYPHVGPDETPNDKLIILEDANGDGRADKVKVFADRLHIPTGFELGDGGVYISQQPNLMFLQDTNGDDSADVRRVILHGFGTEDSHHSIHAYTWGPDGALYFQEGTFLHSQVETPYGPLRVDYAGVFRYEPRTEKLSVFVTYPFANPWGHVIDGWGQNFVTDASNGDNYWGTAFSGHVDYPNKQKPMREWTLTRVRPTSGSEFVRSRHFPESAQGNFLFNNTIGFQGIKQYRTVEDGSGFVGVEVEPLLQSTDPNFRPVAMQFGPDGALYVVDWFNPLVGHMQYSLRDPRRDKTHGRVWRITAKGRPLLRAPGDRRRDDRPAARSAEGLRGSDALPGAARAARSADRGGAAGGAALDRRPRSERSRVRAPPARSALGPRAPRHVNLPLLKRLLGAKEFRARAAAVRVLHTGSIASTARWRCSRRWSATRRRASASKRCAPSASCRPPPRRNGPRRPRQADGLLPAVRPRLDDDDAGAAWKPRLTSGAPFADGQPGRPRLRARAPRAGRAGARQAQRAGLRGAGHASRHRPGAAPRGARARSPPRTNISVARALFAAVGRLDRACRVAAPPPATCCRSSAAAATNLALAAGTGVIGPRRARSEAVRAGRARARCSSSTARADAAWRADRAPRRGCAPTCCGPRPRVGPGPATAGLRDRRSCRGCARRRTGTALREAAAAGHRPLRAPVRPGGPPCSASPRCRCSAAARTSP